MAIKHHPEQALSEHFYGRTGDHWKASVPHMRRRTAGSKVLEVLGLQLTHQDSAWRLPLACMHCSAVELTATGAYPCRYMPGTNDFTHVDGGTSDKYVCESCGKATYPSDLLEHLPAKEKDALVSSTGALKAYAAPVRTFIVAELDGKRSIASTVPLALQQLVGKSFALQQKVCRIQCMDIGHAQELVAKHHAQMPFREIEIGRDLEPLDVGWHGGRLADWERRKLESQAVVARVGALTDLDTELEEIRRTRTAALRTV